MSYEFNPENPVFEFPNPYKVENLALMIAGGVMCATGIVSLLGVRERIAGHADVRVMVVLAISVGLLLFGLSLLAKAFTQLRFFFGRNRPSELAPSVATNADGDSPRAAALKETLRQNALTYAEPRGPLNGLLYSWLPHLIFAPAVIQRAAQTQFHNFLALAATLASFSLCWLLFGQGEASGWVGVAYALVSVPQILRPMAAGAENAAPVSGTVHIGYGNLVLLILMAVLGPVLLAIVGPHLPALGEMSINGSLFVALLCALTGCAVFGIALKNQLQQAPRAVGAARVTETVTMNAHPNKLMEELDRILTERWFNRVPNRRYTHRSPVIAGQQGQFTAEMLEETQPRPQSDRTAEGIGHAFSTPQFSWLAVLSLLSMVFLLAGTFAFYAAGRQLLATAPISTSIGFGSSLLLVGTFCHRAAHALWGRFDFTSELIWVDINGSFESAHMNIGNQISGNVQTGKSVINIESMTMRVWVSEIDTVIFGKDAARQVVGMRGLQPLADDLAAALKNFGESRAMIVAPSSNKDIERAQHVDAVNRLLAGEAAGSTAERLTVAAATLAPQAPTAHGATCPQCRAPVAAGARFCAGCGTRL